MEQLPLELRMEQALNGIITDTILSLEEDVFTVDTVVKALHKRHINGTTAFARGHLRNQIRICILNLVRQGKVLEESSVYRLMK